MTCEDSDEKTREALVEKGARQVASLLASRPVLALARLLPSDVRRAMTTVLLAAANALRP